MAFVASSLREVNSIYILKSSLDSWETTDMLFIVICVLSVNREESVLENIQPIEFHEKMKNPTFLEDAQLIDVREPEEV